MSGTAHDDEETKEDGAQARSVASVVVTGAPPFGEALLQKVIITVSVLAAQNVHDHGEPGRALLGRLVECLDLPLGRLLVHFGTLPFDFAGLGLAVVGNEGLAGLVGVDFGVHLAVCPVDLVAGGRRLDAHKGVEGGIVAFAGNDRVAQLEDFMIYAIELAERACSVMHFLTFFLPCGYKSCAGAEKDRGDLHTAAFSPKPKGKDD